MKICFNLIPPANKMIAILVCILLILSYTKLKAYNRQEIGDSVKTFLKSTHDKNSCSDYASIKK